MLLEKFSIVKVNVKLCDFDLHILISVLLKGEKIESTKSVKVNKTHRDPLVVEPEVSFVDCHVDTNGIMIQIFSIFADNIGTMLLVGQCFWSFLTSQLLEFF